MYKEDFDITEAKSRTELREESLLLPREGRWVVFAWAKHYSQDVNVTESGGVSSRLCLDGKSRGSDQPVSHFHSIPLKVIYNWAVVVWKQHKTKRNTFCVITEPHLLVVITKAYVSGFYIHITSSGLYIHTRESSQAKWRFTKDNINGRGSSVHIYNIKNVSGFIKHGEMEAKEKQSGNHTRKIEMIILHHGLVGQTFNGGWGPLSPQKSAVKWELSSPLCTFSSSAHHLFTWVGLITHTHSYTHTHTCECYKYWKGGWGKAKQLWPQFRCQAAGLVNVKQQDGSPYEAH